jgi:hypothetical protein
MSRGLLLIALPVAALACGCGPSGPEVVKVSGVVTHNGKPIPNVEVFFMPTHGRNSVGMADDQGRFNLGYTADTEGALVGEHTVFVVYHSPTIEQGPVPVDLRPILSKYGSEKSPYKVNITKAVTDLQIKLD